MKKKLLLVAESIDHDAEANDLFSAAEAYEEVIKLISNHSDTEILWLIAELDLKCGKGRVTISQCCGEFTLNINDRIYKFYL